MPTMPVPEKGRQRFAAALFKLALFATQRLLAYVVATRGETGRATRKLHRAEKALREVAGLLGLDPPQPGEFWSPRWLVRSKRNRSNRIYCRLTSWAGMYFPCSPEGDADYLEETALLNAAVDNSGVVTLLLRGEEVDA